MATADEQIGKIMEMVVDYAHDAACRASDDARSLGTSSVSEESLRAQMKAIHAALRALAREWTPVDGVCEKPPFGEEVEVIDTMRFYDDYWARDMKPMRPLAWRKLPAPPEEDRKDA